MVFFHSGRSLVTNWKWRQQANNDYLPPITVTSIKEMTNVDFIKLIPIVLVFLLLFSKCKMFFSIAHYWWKLAVTLQCILCFDFLHVNAVVPCRVFCFFSVSVYNWVVNFWWTYESDHFYEYKYYKTRDYKKNVLWVSLNFFYHAMCNK